MTSELWIGIFIGGGIAMAIFFLITLMWAIVARSSQISREEERLDHEAYFKKRPNYDPHSPDGLGGGIYIGPDDLVFRDKEGVVHIDSLSRPDHDVKSS